MEIYCPVCESIDDLDADLVVDCDGIPHPEPLFCSSCGTEVDKKYLIKGLFEKVSELEHLIKRVYELHPLWMPPKDKVSCEFGNEYEALCSMKKQIEIALESI